MVDRAADDFDMVSEAVRPPVWYNAAFLKDQHFKLRTLANGHPQILQGYFFDVKKLKSRQLAATDAEKIYHSVVNWSACFFFQLSHTILLFCSFFLWRFQALDLSDHLYIMFLGFSYVTCK